METETRVGLPGRRLISAVAGCVLVLLIVGMLAPALVIQPAFDQYTELVGALWPDATAPRVLTVAGGIDALFRHGSVALGCLLVVFSWFFPLVKLLTAVHVCWTLAPGEEPGLWARSLHFIGGLSLTEVVVLGLFALTLKQFPGGTEVDLGWGFWVLFAAAIGGIGVNGWVGRIARVD